MTATTHNPFDESHAGELLEGKPHEQFLWGGAGERAARPPRQPLTRQLFFKWIKQHLRIKAFFGTSEKAVKSQIWIAVCTYLLVAIVRKRLNVQASMHEILQIVSLTLFEITPLDELLTLTAPTPGAPDFSKQLNLLD